MLFTIDAFGRRIPCRPRLVWDGDGSDAGGGNEVTPEQREAAKAAFLAEHGFPSETPVADMEPLQQAAYWRNQAKVQQRKNEGIDVAKLQADSAELERLRKEGMDEHDRALAEAREQARREGENLGAEKYLKDAVVGRFVSHAGPKTQDEIDAIFAHVDPKSFTTAEGALDGDSIKKFADSFGQRDDSGRGGVSTDPVREHLERQRGGGSSGSGNGSVSAMQQQIVDQLTGAK